MNCLRWWRFWHRWGPWSNAHSVTGRLYERSCELCGKPQRRFFWKETWD